LANKENWKTAREEWECTPQGAYDMLNWDLHYGPLTSVGQMTAHFN